MDIETFCSMNDSEVAGIVADQGPYTVVCPINGTRRWFFLEYGGVAGDLPVDYLDQIGRKYIQIFKLLFDHGVQTVLTPSFGPDLLERDPAYLRMAAEGLGRIVTHNDFIRFYDEYDVRASVYGDYARHLDTPGFEHLAGLFDRLAEHSAPEGSRKLFWGMFANDATEAIIQFAIDFFSRSGRPPTREETITAYYGSPIEKADMFIGFDKFAAFDMPLIATGTEDLYFLASPTPYLTRTTLRQILFDYIYQRPQESGYREISQEGAAYMRDFYTQQRDTVFGVGNVVDGVWYPSKGDNHSHTGSA